MLKIIDRCDVKSIMLFIWDFLTHTNTIFHCVTIFTIADRSFICIFTFLVWLGTFSWYMGTVNSCKICLVVYILIYYVEAHEILMFPGGRKTFISLPDVTWQMKKNILLAQTKVYSSSFSLYILYKAIAFKTIMLKSIHVKLW
jgi:hypothetical protein